MSTRCSFFYKDGLHAYRECFTEDLCLEFVPVYFQGEPSEAIKISVNEKYGDPKFSRETWREFAHAILKELETNT